MACAHILLLLNIIINHFQKKLTLDTDKLYDFLKGILLELFFSMLVSWVYVFHCMLTSADP